MTFNAQSFIEPLIDCDLGYSKWRDDVGSDIRLTTFPFFSSRSCSSWVHPGRALWGEDLHPVETSKWNQWGHHTLWGKEAPEPLQLVQLHWESYFKGIDVSETQFEHIVGMLWLSQRQIHVDTPCIDIIVVRSDHFYKWVNSLRHQVVLM